MLVHRLAPLLLAGLLLSSVAAGQVPILPLDPTDPGPTPDPTDPGTVPDPTDGLPAPDPPVPVPDTPAVMGPQCQNVVLVREAGYGGIIEWVGDLHIAYIHPSPLRFHLEPPLTVQDFEGAELPIGVGLWGEKTLDLRVDAYWTTEVKTWEYVEQTFYMTPESGMPYVLAGKGEPQRLCEDAAPVVDEAPPHPSGGYDDWISAAPTEDPQVPDPQVIITPLAVDVRIATHDDEALPRMAGDPSSVGIPGEVHPSIELALEAFHIGQEYLPAPEQAPAPGGKNVAAGAVAAEVVPAPPASAPGTPDRAPWPSDPSPVRSDLAASPHTVADGVDIQEGSSSLLFLGVLGSLGLAGMAPLALRRR